MDQEKQDRIAGYVVIAGIVVIGAFLALVAWMIANS
jgi:hypothetical protein